MIHSNNPNQSEYAVTGETEQNITEAKIREITNPTSDPSQANFAETSFNSPTALNFKLGDLLMTTDSSYSTPVSMPFVSEIKNGHLPSGFLYVCGKIAHFLKSDKSHYDAIKGMLNNDNSREHWLTSRMAYVSLGLAERSTLFKEINMLNNGEGPEVDIDTLRKASFNTIDHLLEFFSIPSPGRRNWRTTLNALEEQGLTVVKLPMETTPPSQICIDNQIVEKFNTWFRENEYKLVHELGLYNAAIGNEPAWRALLATLANVQNEIKFPENLGELLKPWIPDYMLDLVIQGRLNDKQIRDINNSPQQAWSSVC